MRCRPVLRAQYQIHGLRLQQTLTNVHCPDNGPTGLPVSSWRRIQCSSTHTSSLISCSHLHVPPRRTRPAKRYNIIDGKAGWTDRLQCVHSQALNAAQKEQTEQVDVEESKNVSDNVSPNVSESRDDDEEQNESTVPNDEKFQSIKQQIENLAKVTDQLCRLVGKLLPRAQPVIQIKAPEYEDDNDLEQEFRIDFVNTEFNVSLAQTFTLSDLLDGGSLKSIFETLTRAYVERLMDHPKVAEALEHGVTSYSMNNMLKILNMKPISVDFEHIELDRSCSRGFRVHRAQAYSGYEPVGQPQVWSDPGMAERLARYSAYGDLITRAEQEGLDLEEARVNTNIQPANSQKKSTDSARVDYKGEPWKYNVSITQECLSAMLYTLQELRKAGLPDEVEPQPFRTRAKPPPPPPLEEPYFPAFRTISAYSQTKPMQHHVDHELKKILRQRDKLPVRRPETAAKITEMIEHNDVFVLVSETGSGKTTQVPQILLEKAIRRGTGATCNIICTQPRRMAATSVAMRVAQERGTHLGGSVGYQIRFDHRKPDLPGNITYSTAGVLLRMLQVDSERVLAQKSHIVVDEVHERDLTVDLLLAFLRDLMRTRRLENKPFPKIILMSATLKAIEFQEYFAQTYKRFKPRVASMDVSGRAHPVAVHTLDEIIPMMVDRYTDHNSMMSLLKESQTYLSGEDEFVDQQEHLRNGTVSASEEDTDKSDTSTDMHRPSDSFCDAIIPHELITAVIAHILKYEKDGDILVFLPGMAEIDALAITLRTKQPWDLGLGNLDRIRLFKLHSAFHETNLEVFKPVPDGCRRVILATNIAQTSITLPNVVHVVDGGKRREMVYNQVTRQNKFGLIWIDQATSFQRRGRAGRVQPGHYWAMFTEARFLAMPEKSKPEILISDLSCASLILKSYSNKTDLEKFFSRTLDPPHPSVVKACIRELKGMNMLTADEDLTPLGRFCSDFPLHPAKARGLLLGLLFWCFQPMAIIACHDISSPLIHSPNSRREMWYAALQFASASDDDRYAFVSAFRKLEDAYDRGSARDIASLEGQMVRSDVYETMLSVGDQLCRILNDYGLLSRSHIAPYGTETEKQSFLRRIPIELDRNSQRLNLLKALALTIDNANLAVWREEQQAWMNKDLKCMLRPYGVNTMESFKLLNRASHRKTGEIVGFSEMIRNPQTSSRPFLVQTSSITPLMAMLFGGPIKMIEHNVIEINGWLRYEIEVAPSEADGNARADFSTVELIIEFRKALDRFLTLAFSDLVDLTRLSNTEKRRTQCNKLFESNKLRSVMVDGISLVLDLDSRHWDETIHASQQELTL